MSKENTTLSLQRILFFKRTLSEFHSNSLSDLIIRNRHGDPWVSQRIRPRRNRKSEAVRSLVRENLVTPR